MSRRSGSLLLAIALAGSVLFGVAPARAAIPATSGTPDQLQRGPSVARISVIDRGTIVIQRGDNHRQVAGAINAPLMPGDFISTGERTQAEIQLDGYTMLRLDSNVQARLVANDSSARQLQLAAGTVELSIVRAGDAAASIDTPSVTLRATQVGDYRLTIDASGSTSATARTGAAELVTPQKTYSIAPGTTYVAKGNAANPAVTPVAEAAFDDFDDFNASRDKTLLAAVDGDANVPQSVSGYDDLNAYGRWVTLQPYGNVWVPNGVGSDWVPYRNGQWSWVAGYGWTWVSNEPWGWIPYHYGNWVLSPDYGWCWVPPAAGSAPAWQPAMVSFYGGGYNPGSFGFGLFAWAPLAPYQPYYPWYTGWNNNKVYYVPPAPPVGPRPPFYPRPPVVVRPPRGVAPRAVPGLTAVDAKAFHEGDFSHPIDLSGHPGTELMPIHGILPIAPGPANYTYSRAQVKPAEPPAPAFPMPRSAPLAPLGGAPSRYAWPSCGHPSAPAAQPQHGASPSHGSSSGSHHSGSRPPHG